MKTKLYLMALASLWLYSCSSAAKQVEEEVEEGLPVINLSDNVEEVRQLSLSDAVESVEAVRLENRKDVLVPPNISTIHVTEHDIFINNGISNIFRFSRDGKFLNMIGRQGQGPGEYDLLKDFYVDEEREEIYTFSIVTGINVYDYEGKFLKKVTNRRLAEMANAPNHREIVYNGQFLLSRNMGFYVEIENPVDSLWSIAVLDENFNVEKGFKNPAHLGREKEIVSEEHRAPYTGWVNYWVEPSTSIEFYNHELTFKWPDTDTIYSYRSQEKDIVPKYAIYTDEKQGDFNLMHEFWPERRTFTYFRLRNYFSTQDYIYLLGSKDEQIYTYAYNKQDHTVKLWKRKGVIEEINLPPLKAALGRNRYRFTRNFTLANDINGGDFTVDYRSQGKYWINQLNPGSSDYEKYVEDLRKSDAPKKQEVLNVLDNTDEEDNPILLIAVLK